MESFAPLVQQAKMGDGRDAYQLDRLAETRVIIANAVEKRLRGKRHAAAQDWHKLVNDVLGVLGSDAHDETEEAARHEKAAVLEEVFASRLSVLIGPAGTGKTTSTTTTYCYTR